MLRKSLGDEKLKTKITVGTNEPLFYKPECGCKKPVNKKINKKINKLKKEMLKQVSINCGIPEKDLFKNNSIGVVFDNFKTFELYNKLKIKVVKRMKRRDARFKRYLTITKLMNKIIYRIFCGRK